MLVTIKVWLMVVVSGIDGRVEGAVLLVAVIFGKVGIVIVEVYFVGDADNVVVFSIVLVTEMVSVTLSIGIEDVLVAAHPPSTPTTE
ncbi:MAG: hypothetical protein Q9210_000807 [Variospora velana]